LGNSLKESRLFRERRRKTAHGRRFLADMNTFALFDVFFIISPTFCGKSFCRIKTVKHMPNAQYIRRMLQVQKKVAHPCWYHQIQGVPLSFCTIQL